MAITLIRTIILYSFIIFGIKMMGKRQISDLQTSELVITIMISNIAAFPMENASQPLLSSLIPIAVLVCCEILLSCLMLKSPKVRNLICGKPMVIINDGKVKQDALKYLRMSTEDLFGQLRQAQVFSLNDVWFAVIETNGKMSVLKKSGQQPPSASNLGLKLPEPLFDAVIISDGKISEHSLKLCGLNEKWLTETLKQKNIKQDDVFIMTANKNKEFNIIKKEIPT